MMHTTKVFNNGNSQAVRIPREFRFEQDEVYISKIGSAVVIFQRGDRYAVLMESLAEFTDDYLKDGRPTQALPNERVLFDWGIC